jgi:hypothetical protein
LSGSENLERQKYEAVIESLQNRRVPDNPDLFTCGSQAAKIYATVTEEIKHVVEKDNNLTVRVVTGNFGAGKSHLAKNIEHELYVHFGNKVLVSKVDANLANSFPEIIEQILVRLRNSEGHNLNRFVMEIGKHLENEIRLTVSERIWDAFEGGVRKERLCDRMVKFGFDTSTAEKLAEYVMKDGKGEASALLPRDINCLKALFCFLQAKSYHGICVFLDEFETLDVKENKEGILDMLRAMHEQGNSLRSTYVLVLTRSVFWEKVKEICYPLYDRWDGKRTLTLGELDLRDTTELLERLLSIYEKAGKKVMYKDSAEVRDEANKIHDGLNAGELSRTFRAVIIFAIEKIEQEWRL